MRWTSKLALALAISVLTATVTPSWAAPFQDALVQAPSLAAPQRGSVAGTLSRLAFGPGDLDRGAFNVPLALDAPDERGPLLARVAPAYSPESGIGEWGQGWSVELAIKRFRPRGELNFVDDEFTSPWGRLAAGDDGNYYPAGLTTVVRVAPDGAGGWSADSGDGTRYTFAAADAVAAPGGTVEWKLSRVDTITGDSTVLDWTHNASGRAFLTGVHWGGRGDGTQYRMALGYETLATAFTAYAAGAPQVLDRRVTSVTVEVQNAGVFQTRWRYDLTYTTSPSGPAFYLQTVTKTFASGEADPPITYDYDLNAEHLATAELTRVPKLDGFLATYGSLGLQPDHVAIADLERDGLPDLEASSDFQTAHQTATGFVLEPLPAASGTSSVCRPAPAANNQPRLLARMHGDAAEPQVVAARTSGVSTEMLICDRLGVPIFDQTISGNWQPAANIKLADLDRDQRPDFVRVGAGAVTVLRNTSTSPTVLSFAPGPTTILTPSINPVASWILDFNGDGEPDLVERTNVSVVVWLGKGDGTFEPRGTTYFFNLSNGSLFSTLTNWQFTYGDYNADGLTDVILTQGQNVLVFTNRGGSFGQVKVPGLTGISWTLSLPMIQDLAGTGDEVAMFAKGTQGMGIDLTTASTGLLRSADDGKGTVVSFGYDRAPAAPGIGKRHAVLSTLSVASSGYDDVSFTYRYGAPVLHTVGKYLVGYASVDKQSPFLLEHAEFTNDDDVTAVATLNEQTDDRTPGIIQLARHTYDDEAFHGIRWLRPAQSETGYRNDDSSVRLTTTTQFVTYEREVCPTVTVADGPSGRLITMTSLASVAALADDLHCLSSSQRLIGSHPSSALDFNYLLGLTRNDLGQITNLTQYDATMAVLDLQDVVYGADHRVANASWPGQGTTTVGYDGLGRLETITDPTGVIHHVSAFDPAIDGMTQLDTVRPAASMSAFFRYDGRERLQASWDDVSGGSALVPLSRYTYRDATAAQPGRIDTQTLVDALTGTPRTAVSLFAADGTAIVDGVWLGDRFMFGRAAFTDRATLTQRTSFVGSLTSEALAALTSENLRALGTPLDATLSAGFGHEIESTETHQAGVTGTTTTTRVLAAGELITRTTDPAGFITEAADDGAGHLVRRLDENAVGHHYTYDALGRLVHVVTPDGEHTIGFDGFGRPARVARDGIGAITYAYDPNSGLIARKQWLDAAGHVVDTSTTTYDAIGRPREVAQTAADDARTVDLDYDGALDGTTVPGQLGRLSRVHGDGWARTTVYDALDHVSAQHTSLTGWRDVTTDKTYRADGSVATDTLTIKDSAGATQLVRDTETTLDALGRVHTFEVNGAVLYTLAYDAEGRLARADFTSGDVITFTYDATTHERRGHGLASSTASGGVAWERDARGLITRETYVNGSMTTVRAYGYDGRGALLSSVADDDRATYTYTTSGLPASVTDVAGTRALHHTASTLAVGDVTYTWDAAGRVAGKGAWTFTYGGNGQIVRAERAGRRIEFLYDEANQRLLKKIDGAPMRAEVAGGVLTSDHFVELVVVGGVVAGVLDNGQFQPLLTDPRGTPFAARDGRANFATPYGVRATPTDVSEVLDYARLAWDPDLDIVRMGVRDYDAKLAQFFTPDPSYFESLDQCQSSPLQCTLYGYAGGNPISFIDPTGLGFWHWVRNFAADAIDLGATVAGGLVGGTASGIVGAPTGPGDVVVIAGGAVLGAGLARGAVSPLTDRIRGVEPSIARVAKATADGMTAEMGGQVIGKGINAAANKLLAARAAAKQAEATAAANQSWVPNEKLANIIGYGTPTQTTLEVRAAIAELPRRLFKCGQCKEAATALVDALKARGISGELLEFASPGARNGYVVHDLYEGGVQTISKNGEHAAVRVGEFVFDNLFPQGVPYQQYLDGLQAAGGNLSNGAITVTATPF